MNDEASWQAAERIAHHALCCFQSIAADQGQPSVLYRPALSIIGGKWCALYGENLRYGVAGFGNSPAEAMHDFNRAWYAKRPAQEQPE